jgi:putative ABC transport system permease protein
VGKLRLIARLAARDLRHRPAQAALLLLAIAAATAVLTLGLALNGVTSRPYQQTKAATRGPDIVAQQPGGPGRRLVPPGGRVVTLARAPGVSAASGPFPEVAAYLRARGLLAGAEVQGRAAGTSAVDQPKLTAGSWVRPGGVVIERTFAQALGVGVGDRITLDGHPFTVVGIAVTAATAPFPNLCATVCFIDLPPGPMIDSRQIGLVWATEPAALRLAPAGGGSVLWDLETRSSPAIRAVAPGRA